MGSLMSIRIQVVAEDGADKGIWFGTARGDSAESRCRRALKRKDRVVLCVLWDGHGLCAGAGTLPWRHCNDASIAWRSSSDSLPVVVW